MNDTEAVRDALTRLAATFEMAAEVPPEFFPSYRDWNGKPLWAVAGACREYILRFCDERYPKEETPDA